jgi:hypothetical protein
LVVEVISVYPGKAKNSSETPTSDLSTFAAVDGAEDGTATLRTPVTTASRMGRRENILCVDGLLNQDER